MSLTSFVLCAAQVNKLIQKKNCLESSRVRREAGKPEKRRKPSIMRSDTTEMIISKSDLVCDLTLTSVHDGFCLLWDVHYVFFMFFKYIGVWRHMLECYGALLEP